MNLLLINPDYMRYNSPPLGLIALAAYVRRECSFLNVKMIDQVPENKILDKIEEISPEIIGISAVSENYYFVKVLAKKIKKRFPKIILVLGGIHISTSPLSFKDSPFDLAIRGEGELSFTQLLKSIYKNKGINKKELRKIRGLMYCNGKKIIEQGVSDFVNNLNELPVPARDLLNNDYYTLPSISAIDDFDPVGYLITSRGCPHNCRFCSSFALWGQRIRFFSAERVVEEIEILYKKYKYRKIAFLDDVFTINKPRLRKIVELLKAKSYFGKIKFSALGRADTFDEETAQLLKEMGTYLVTFGIETGSQKMLTYLKRGIIKVEDGVKAINIAKKYNMMGGGFFMIGSPTEDLKDMEQTYQFIKTHCRNNFAIHQTVPLPGTEVWDYAIANKIIMPDFYDHPQKDFIDINPNFLLSKDISKEEFEKMHHNIKSLQVKKTRKETLSKLRHVRLRHLRAFLNPIFLRKAFNLKDRILKKIISSEKINKNEKF